MIVLHGYQTLPPEVIADRESQIEQEFLADQGKYDTEVVQTVEPNPWLYDQERPEPRKAEW